MADTKEEKELIKKRGSYKGRVTSFTNYLKNLSPSLDRSQVNELQLRVDKMLKLYELYDEVQTKLECIVEDVDTQLAERATFESIYYNVIAQAQEIISINSQIDQSFRSESEHSSPHHESFKDSVKLPTISLPQFTGSYDSWLEYHDTFMSLIHTNNNISNINKFHYLRASLQGSAAVVIQSIPFSANNYQVAWQLLCDRYENRRLLIQNHVSALFNITSISKESSSNIRRILDDLNKNLRALESLKEPTDHWDTLLIHLISSKLDQKSYREWEEAKSRLDKIKTITLDIFVTFLRNKADLLESLELSHNHQSSSQSNMNKGNNAKIKSMLSLTDPSADSSSDKATINNCLMCSSDHWLQDCPEFLALTNEERLKLLPAFKICFNCFRKGHYANQCKKGGCKICKRRHNSLIHATDSRRPSDISERVLVTTSSDTSDSSCEKQVTSGPDTVSNVTLSAKVNTMSGATMVLLSTALVKLYDHDNHEHIARAVLDSGSTSCLMTERLFQQLKLPATQVNKTVLGINNSLSHVGKMCHLNLHSFNSDFNTNINCFVLPMITDEVPCRTIDISEINIPANITLCDPNFHTPSNVDLIIGADVFWDLLGSQKINLGKGKPILYETKLGWLVSGSVGIHNLWQDTHPIKCNFTKVHSFDHSTPLFEDIQTQLTHFWELEEVGHKSTYYTKEESMCESHFINNVTRVENGRFCVKIPLKKAANALGCSSERAKYCFLSLERKMQNNAIFKKMYNDFMTEYLQLGHMSECLQNQQQFSYFIPHHGVIRDSSVTTKLRVVFNGSSPTSSGESLNSIQMVGPTIQDDLLSILIRFRQHKYILAADVEKMYRQIMVHPSDRHLQQIFWRNDPSDTLKVYQLNTVTYGTASAPFLAIRCLKQIGLNCTDKNIAEIIIHDFYVDDLLTGASSIEQGLEIRAKVTEALKSACMPLRKWKSNAPSLLTDETINSSLDLNIGALESNKTLGLGWHPRSDEIYFSINFKVPDTITKRSMLSLISQIFDPMGLLSPCIITFKIILQKLWLHKLSWDEVIPSEINQHWANAIKNLSNLNKIRIPRRVICDNQLTVHLHIFTDASQDAYGACIYVRSVNDSDVVSSRLLIAKSRVAPIKPTTIPRLELCGALVGARLYEKVVSSFRMKVAHCTFWTDSTIVLGWLKMHPNRLQPFVRNRVAEILDKTNHCIWRHVVTKNNPADHVSRGVDPLLLGALDQWWHGPDFLLQDESLWPASKVADSDILPEIRSETTLNAVSTDTVPWIDFNRFSNLTRLTRAIAYLLRFVSNCKSSSKCKSGLTVEEINKAFKVIIRSVQKETFPEYKMLLEGKGLPNKNHLMKFNVFLDTDLIMRVGGRLSNSEFPYEKKHPILIQSNHHYTKLLFRHEHLRLLHAGPQLLLASVKEKFWPIGGRNLARLCYRSCIRCSRMKAKTTEPIMGDLPQHRVRCGGFPFENVGVDYAGPLMAASRQGRGCRLIKVYAAVFVCFATKAIHLELVGDLTSNCFLSCLRRFIARRGKPFNIFSDNGTSFVGAFNDLNKFLKSNSDSLSDSVANEGIQFHFIPAYAPHFGGLWEAGVKSTKYHLNRVLGNCNLTYEELSTVLVQIEAVLNSRPLTPFSSSPDDLQALTPGHFIIGRSMTALPTKSYVDSRVTHLGRYQRMEQLRQHFWMRWSKEYISELQQRTKWRADNNPLDVNMMVLVKDDNLPPLKWKLGRIINVYPGRDGVNRVADIKTATGVIRRASSKLCPLPLQD